MTVKEGSFKASKGLIRVKVETDGLRIKDVTISGDFFMYPEDRLWELERHLIGTIAKRDDLLTKIMEFYNTAGILTPGVRPEDFVEAVTRATESS